MKKKILISLMTLLIVVISAEEQDYKLGLGFGGGIISGSGFSLRKLSDKGGFQINLGAIIRNDTGCDDCFDYDHSWLTFEDTTEVFTERAYDGWGNINAGINLYKTLHNGRKSKLYLLAGTAGYLNFETRYEQDFAYNENDQEWEKNGDMRSTKDTELTINLGAGFGFDYKLSKNIRLNLEWPLAISFSTGGTNIFMYIPQAGIHYYFK
ncbi:MAG: outer membrane beta-barrel protein [Candidatus Cloacimonetes bacterium]|nr:outer membrane beta-barrel protein [Candidatus Cloacimonadota bacterium]